MKLFDVYSRFAIEPVEGRGRTITASDGKTYLDMYGGHGVISIGHSHPRFVEAIREQAGKLGYYNNSVINQLQRRLAERLGELSGYEEYDLYLCNSGAEAIENALKLASFHTSGTQVIAFRNSFHGRTSAALGVTDDPGIRAPMNAVHTATFLPVDDPEEFRKALGSGENIAAVIIEGIQGLGGIYEASGSFQRNVMELCKEKGVPFILDEMQSGYGRTGDFFAHQAHNFKPDMVARGMGNGFPLGAVLISPDFGASHGMLGTMFGGNHLACAAGLAVLDVIEEEDLMENAALVGAYLASALRNIPDVVEVRGRGLMIGVEFRQEVAELRDNLLFEHQVFTGSSRNRKTIRLLPPLSLTHEEAQAFVEKLDIAMRNVLVPG